MAFDTDFKNEFSWSKTRRDVFDECRRRYFYQYYDSWGGWDRFADPRTRALYLLGKLQTRHLWMGTVVHDRVRELLDRSFKGGRKPDPDEYADLVISAMRGRFKESLDRRHVRDPKRFLRLFEHEYGLEVDAGEWGEFRDRTRECIVNFLRSSWFDEFASLSPTDVLELDPPRPSHFPVKGTRVWVKIDLAYRRQPEGGFIWDWKTGRLSGEETSVQLLTYALYAHKLWKLDPAATTLREYYLFSDQTVDYAAKPRDLKETIRVIAESVERMKSALAEPGTNTPHPEEFYGKTDNESACRWCNYRKLCLDLEPPEKIIEP